jgi:hypothetical protein
MQTVICDTNIWYDLAENRKNIDRLVGVELIATSVNITEIASAPYLVSDIGLIARTADAMYKNNHKVVISNPMEYLISLFHWEYEPNTIAERRLLEGLNTLMDMDLNYIPAQNIVDTERQIKEVLDSQNELASRINNGLQKIRQNIKRQEGKEKYRKIDFIDKWKKYFSELVLDTWEYYFKNNLEIGNWKFDKNDWCDLFNLVYVYPGSKYWTSECKWNRIFDSNERLRKYNFST